MFTKKKMELFLTRQCIVLLSVLTVVFLSHYVFVATLIHTLLCSMWRQNATHVIPLGFHVACGILCTLIESICVTFSTESWYYHHQTFYNVPLWLFPFWSLLSGFVLDVYFIMSDVKTKKTKKTTRLGDCL